MDEDARLHAQLGHYARLLWDIQKLRIQVGNRISAIERDAAAHGLSAALWTQPHEATLKNLETQERSLNGQLERLVKQKHFMAAWIDACPGLGFAGFARIVGVTGDFRRFATVSKVWKYMGLHTEDGQAPRRQRGAKLGYAPQGRVVARQIAESIVKLGRGRYRELYDRKRLEYVQRERHGESGCPFGQVHKDRNGKLLACVKQAENKETSAHVHSAAMRYAVKQLLKDLWVAWRRDESG